MLDSAFGQFMSNVFGSFDMSVFGVFAAIQNSVLNEIAIFISSFCSEYFLIMLGILSFVLCLFKKWRRLGIAILLAVFFAVVIGKLVLNPIAGRLRPYNTLQGTGDYFSWYTAAGMIPESKYSFPSCHTFAAFALACSLFVLLKEKKSWKSLFLWVFALLIGCSRIYLMVHYPTDVIAGLLLGVFFGFIAGIFAKAYDKRVLQWPVLNVLDRIDLEKVLIKFNNRVHFSSTNRIKETHFDSKHPKHSKQKMTKISLDFKLIIIAVVLIMACSVVLQEYGVRGGFHRCDHQGNDYICMNKAKNKVEDGSQVKYFCDLHENEISKVD